MKSNKLLVLLLLSSLTLFNSSSVFGKAVYIFGSGPSDMDGVFSCGNEDDSYADVYYAFANAIARYSPIGNNSKFSLHLQPSCGTIENLQKVHSGEFDLAIVESSDLYVGRNGMLPNDSTQYTNVKAVAYLFGRYFQVMVADSHRQKVSDLEKGSKVRFSTSGKENASFLDGNLLFLTHLGLWPTAGLAQILLPVSEITPALERGIIDASLGSYHYPVFIMFEASTIPGRLLDADYDAQHSGFYSKYPCFIKATIPAATYPDIATETNTWQYGVLLVANSNVPASHIYDILSKIYSDKGLSWIEEMTKGTAPGGSNSMAGEMSIDTGKKTITTFS